MTKIDHIPSHILYAFQWQCASAQCHTIFDRVWMTQNDGNMSITHSTQQTTYCELQLNKTEEEEKKRLKWNPFDGIYLFARIECAMHERPSWNERVFDKKENPLLLKYRLYS